MNKFTILGAGLSGLSASYHLGHKNCRIYEKKNYSGGHIFSEKVNDVIWDQGPHISFTKNEYVKGKFAESCKDDYNEFSVKTASYYQGFWIPHPAQTNLFAVPQPLREKCLNDFLCSRKTENSSINNYEEWLIEAFGKTFYENFPKVYTLKYWTVDPSLLTTDWVGERVFYPSEAEVLQGSISPLLKQTHYINKVRYPRNNGFSEYKNIFESESNINFNYNLERIYFDSKTIQFSNGKTIKYQKLISTIPLPVLIEKSDAPCEIKLEAKKLSCSSVLLINIVADHETSFNFNWMYVYDVDKISTRINCSEMLSSNNVPQGKTAVQVEVYFSKYKEKIFDNSYYLNKVIIELLEMKIIKDENSILSTNTKWVEWANVIFDFNRKIALNNVLSFLETKGYQRTESDLLPMTDWQNEENKVGDIILAGRFAEWKYYWTDDCVLRGKSIKI